MLRLRTPLVALVVGATLWPKLPAPLPVADQPGGPLSDILRNAGFAVVEERSDADLRVVRASRDGCSMLAAQVSPAGWHRHVFAGLAGGAQVTYVFGGAAFDEQPIWRTRLALVEAKLRRLAGREVPEIVVMAVAGAAACGMPLPPRSPG